MVLQGGWIDWHFHSGVASQVALVVKNLPANAGDIKDAGSSPRQEDPLEEHMATHSSILAMDRGAWQATVHGVAESQTQLKQLSMQHAMQLIFNIPRIYIFYILFFPPNVHLKMALEVIFISLYTCIMLHCVYVS